MKHRKTCKRLFMSTVTIKERRWFHWAFVASGEICEPCMKPLKWLGMLGGETRLFATPPWNTWGTWVIRRLVRVYPAERPRCIVCGCRIQPQSLLDLVRKG